MLSKIHLTNFRNYPDLKLEFNHVNFIIGPNGIGKTNILEAVEMLSTARSHRTRQDKSVIMYDANFARLEGTVEDEKSRGESATLALVLELQNDNLTKTYLINNQPKRAAQVLGNLPTVVFSPDTLNLMYGPPSIRRRALDAILTQTDRHYLHSLWQYNRVLKERNRLLFAIKENRSHPDELPFWDDELVKHGSQIINARQLLINEFNQFLSQKYQELSLTNSTVNIEYNPSVEVQSFARTLASSRLQEISSALTLVGPHRDECTFFLSGHPISLYASRGESRTTAIAFKLIELTYLAEKVGRPPLLLLDDVFSELDRHRRLKLLDLISTHQTLITSTEPIVAKNPVLSSAKIINLPLTQNKKTSKVKNV